MEWATERLLVAVILGALVGLPSIALELRCRALRTEETPSNSVDRDREGNWRAARGFSGFLMEKASSAGA
jgi:hypothetical protein